MTELTVSNLTNSVTWYHEVLGFKVKFEDHAHHYVLLDHPHGGQLALKQGTDLSQNVILLFSVVDLQAELDRLLTLGHLPHGDLKTSAEGYRRATFFDCDSNKIIVFEWTTPRTEKEQT